MRPAHRQRWLPMLSTLAVAVLAAGLLASQAGAPPPTRETPPPIGRYPPPHDSNDDLRPEDPPPTS